MSTSTCPSCSRPQPPGANFCSHCGFALGERTPPRAYTPRHLAEGILASRAALEGERKQVTVLFVDVKGSVELARTVGAEEWHRLLDRFFGILAAGVHRFDGTVNQYTGDGIMALFGAPLAQEDHAQRACHAALHLRDSLREYAAELRNTRRLRFGVRMGLNSGEVIVGKIGDDLRMDYTALGDTVGLAARMERAAGVDRIYLSGHTAAHVADFFQLDDVGTRRIKGADGPVRVYALVGSKAARTRLDVTGARGACFLGREAEVAALRAALARALSGYGQVVTVVGEPGVGKSRLCQEFIAGCRAERIAVAEAHCPTHGRALPYFAVVELLRGLLGAESADGSAGAKQLSARLKKLPAALRDDVPLVLDVLGLPQRTAPPPISEAEKQTRLTTFVQRFVQSRSGTEPLVLLIDDAHWLDAESEAILATLAEAVGWTRTFLLVNHRPEYKSRLSHLSYSQTVELQPLAPGASEALLAQLIGDDASTAALRRGILARAAGNAFFLEEIVHALVQQGVLVAGEVAGEGWRAERAGGDVAMDVPATIQALVASRIDRLAEREKTVLQVSAVLGKGFAREVLGRTLAELADISDVPAGAAEADVGGALAALARTNFLRCHGEGESAVEFHHPLTQEVAYHSLLTERRNGIHAAAARALEKLSPESLGQRATLIAHHWKAAGRRDEAHLWRWRAALNVTNIQPARKRPRE